MVLVQCTGRMHVHTPGRATRLAVGEGGAPGAQHTVTRVSGIVILTGSTAAHHRVRVCHVAPGIHVFVFFKCMAHPPRRAATREHGPPASAASRAILLFGYSR